MKSPARLSTTYPTPAAHEQHAEDARDVARPVEQEPQRHQVDAEEDEGEQEARAEAVDGRQRHGLTLLLAQTRRAGCR